MIISIFYKESLWAVRSFVTSPWMVLFGVFAMVLPLTAYCSEDLKDIIVNIRANERLYKNLDVVIHYEYVDSQEWLSYQEGFLPIKQEVIDIRYVKQEGMFHLAVQGIVHRMASEQKEETVARNKILLFDGNTSRALQGNRANIIAGPTLDKDMISPHMLIIKTGGYPVPLSTYMEGHQAMLAYRGLKWDPGIHIHTESQGEEVIDNHLCQKVAIKHVIAANGYLHSAWVFWLATDRNYLPLRCEAYAYNDSKTIPAGQAVSRDLREIAPGVWFPHEVICTRYNWRTLRDHQRQELGWRERFTVKSVSLEPHYPVAFFRDLKIPDGTYVYHVDANGKIERNYIQGAPSKSVTHRTSSRWLLFWGSISALIVCTIILIARRRMKLCRLHPP
jgi:hypothetical protein